MHWYLPYLMIHTYENFSDICALPFFIPLSYDISEHTAQATYMLAIFLVMMQSRVLAWYGHKGRVRSV